MVEVEFRACKRRCRRPKQTARSEAGGAPAPRLVANNGAGFQPGLTPRATVTVARLRGLAGKATASRAPCSRPVRRRRSCGDGFRCGGLAFEAGYQRLERRHVFLVAAFFGFAPLLRGRAVVARVRRWRGRHTPAATTSAEATARLAISKAVMSVLSRKDGLSTAPIVKAKTSACRVSSSFGITQGKAVPDGAHRRMIFSGHLCRQCADGEKRAERRSADARPGPDATGGTNGSVARSLQAFSVHARTLRLGLRRAATGSPSSKLQRRYGFFRDRFRHRLQPREVSRDSRETSRARTPCAVDGSAPPASPQTAGQVRGTQDPPPRRRRSTMPRTLARVRVEALASPRRRDDCPTPLRVARDPDLLREPVRNPPGR